MSRDEQQVHFWDEERRPRSWSRAYMAYAAVGILSRIKSIQIAIPAADVYTLAFLIHERVVCISAQLSIHDWGAVVDGKCGESWRVSQRNEDMARLLVQRHGEIGAVGCR